MAVNNPHWYSNREFLPSWFRTKVRFEKKGCWEWVGTKDAGGYGTVRGQKAHRVSYELHVGKIGAGRLIRHTCDNRACVNPAHLRQGSARDNWQDMADRDRNSQLVRSREAAARSVELYEQRYKDSLG